MAKPNHSLIQAIRRAANKISTGNSYHWGNMGNCNCGHLAQELTNLSASQIHEQALKKYGDWEIQCIEYCPKSKLPIDTIITTMLEAGLDLEDIQNLERLSDKTILNRLPERRSNLRYNIKEDVVTYLNTWANMLEEKLLENIKLSQINECYEIPVN
jgi:hypothetical protein